MIHVLIYLAHILIWDKETDHSDSTSQTPLVQYGGSVVPRGVL